ncbi:glycosyltransferase [Litorisediminicola beolgyonensis]|uniref:Glycosyltransferase n=1 Tax=Litorisediminicola beolgyonensis TaxID=1173614 RepID=A0ABW3ZJ46_9RHOB
MKIGIGAITRRRPAMFARLLTSFEGLERPDGAELVFLFAENDSALTVEEIVAGFRGRVPEEVALELEPEPGIPFARNKVLDMALARDCDFLTFVDDDEMVTPGWLKALLGAAESRGLDLVGGPIRLVAPEDALDFWERAALDHAVERMEKRASSRAKEVKSGREGRSPVYTNNWLGRLSTVRAKGLRFDETLRYTGGSDTRFSRDMTAAGGKVGWAPDAWTIQPEPKKRLGLRYIYDRARDQAINAIRLRDRPAWRVLATVPFRLLDFPLLLIAAPVLRGRAAAKAAYKAGVMVGRIRAVTGARSAHYAPGTEAVHTEETDRQSPS